ncbi:hypothetical protein HC928_25685 [bacterium]|nr:hypothetical protein [bacterium]
MKVSIRDEKFLSNLDLDRIKSYLISKGWQKLAKDEGKPVVAWILTVQDSEVRNIELLVNQNSSFSMNYVCNMLEVLENVEGRSQLDIVSDIRHFYADIFRFHINSLESHSVEGGNGFTLDTTIQILQYLKDSFCWAASSVAASDLSSERKIEKSRVSNYINCLQFEQSISEQGETFTIVSPLQKTSIETLGYKSEAEFDEPFERLAAKKVVYLLKEFSPENGVLSHGDSVVHCGDDFHGTFARLREVIGNRKFSLSVRWSPAIYSPHADKIEQLVIGIKQ